MNLEQVNMLKLSRKDVGLKTVFTVLYKSGLFWIYMLYGLGLVGIDASCFWRLSIGYFGVVGGERR